MGDPPNPVPLNLLAVFTFYLWAMFFVSTVRRLSQYRDFVQLAVNIPQRWPKVLGQMKQHSWLFGTWATIRPAGLTLLLIALQMFCSKVVWPHAWLTPAQLQEHWLFLPILLLSGSAMAAVDLYGIYRVGNIDRASTEKYLDEAEHWLTSWKSPLIKSVTLGYINPRAIVDVEVRKALEQGNTLLQKTFRWLVLQYSVRIVFGVCLWWSWASISGTPQNAG
jgi:hypothetical protein